MNFNLRKIFILFLFIFFSFNSKASTFKNFNEISNCVDKFSSYLEFKYRFKDCYEKKNIIFDDANISFEEYDRCYCWLCSKPLWVNDTLATPQSEHKNPCICSSKKRTGPLYNQRKYLPN